jgi:hypothetical protein
MLLYEQQEDRGRSKIQIRVRNLSVNHDISHQNYQKKTPFNLLANHLTTTMAAQ